MLDLIIAQIGFEQGEPSLKRRLKSWIDFGLSSQNLFILDSPLQFQDKGQFLPVPTGIRGLAMGSKFSIQSPGGHVRFWVAGRDFISGFRWTGGISYPVLGGWAGFHIRFCFFGWDLVPRFLKNHVRKANLHTRFYLGNSVQIPCCKTASKIHRFLNFTAKNHQNEGTVYNLGS